MFSPFCFLEKNFTRDLISYSTVQFLGGSAYPEEMTKYGVKEIKECGEMISFVPTRCQVVHPPRWKKVDEVYFVVVEAPQLDKIREKYGLPKREYDFHITIGVKRKIAKSA
jgi:hypothetical protein